MALRPLLLRFWVTDNGDCHFREESLEKVTDVTSKRREELTKSSKSSNTRFTEFTELMAGARRAASLSAFRDGIGRNFKNAPITNCSHLILN